MPPSPIPESSQRHIIRGVATWPKALAKLAGDKEAPLASYHCPAEHGIHLRTSTRFGSTFAWVR